MMISRWRFGTASPCHAIARPARAALLVLDQVSWAPRAGATVLQGISLAIPEGQVVGICGANGAGKSSLLRLIYRYQRPISGTVRLLGQDIWQLGGPEVARRIAAVLQEQPSDLELTVEQIVGLGRLPHQRGPRISQRDHEVCAKAMEQMGLAALAKRRLATLSGGERQRAMVARALAQEPEILVLDEPTNHLDIRHQLELLALLRTLGLTVITTLHDLSMAAGFADRIILLHRGTVLSDGPPETVMTAEHLSTAFDICAHVDATGARPRFDFHL